MRVYFTIKFAIENRNIQIYLYLEYANSQGNVGYLIRERRVFRNKE